MDPDELLATPVLLPPWDEQAAMVKYLARLPEQDPADLVSDVETDMDDLDAELAENREEVNA